MAFARSLGEFGATVMFAGNVAGKTQTLSLAIFSFSERPGIEGEIQMWRLAFISALLAASSLGLSEYLEHRAGRV